MVKSAQGKKPFASNNVLYCILKAIFICSESRDFKEHYTPFRGSAKAKVLSKKLFTVLTPTSFTVQI